MRTLKTAVIILTVGLVATLFWRAIANTAETYIRGYTGLHCYVNGQQHKNINLEKALYFSTLEECLDSLQ